MDFSNFCLIANDVDGAAIAQHVNGQYAFLFAAIAFVLMLAMLFEYYRHRQSKFIVIAATILTLTHPIWTVSAARGDLGYVQRNLAFVWTAIVALLFLGMHFSHRDHLLWSKKSSSFRSACFGVTGAAIGFLAFALFVYSTAVLPDSLNVELFLVKRFGPNAFIYLVLVTFPIAVLLGCFFGFWHARVALEKLRTVSGAEHSHPLD